MQKDNLKPTPQAKALSLFLMAYKSKNNSYKEHSKRINRQWDLVRVNEISMEEYMEEVEKMLTKFGGYDAVIEKTVQHYLDKTGAWKLKGDDQYSKDAKKIADKLSKK